MSAAVAHWQAGHERRQRVRLLAAPRRAPLATLKDTLPRPSHSLAAAAARWQARHERRQRVCLLVATAPGAAAVGDQRQLHLSVALALAPRHLYCYTPTQIILKQEALL